MSDKFTIEEIRNYLKSQDSLGDIFYNLSAENIRKANPIEEEQEDDFEDMTEEDDEEEQEQELPIDRLIVVRKPKDRSSEAKPPKEFNTDFIDDGLRWFEIDDENIILDIIHLTQDIKPYYEAVLPSKTETRFNIDGERYRILHDKNSGDNTIERLDDSMHCTHQNVSDGICLDCDEKLEDE